MVQATVLPRSRKIALSPELTAVLTGITFLVAAGMTILHRHFYDDETINASYLLRYDLSGLIHRAQTTDVHPPLQYIANWLTYHAFGSLEAIWCVNACVVAAATSYFVWALSARVPDWRGRLVLVLTSGLNPSLLLWCVSLRWYAYWVPLSMVIVTLLYLRPRTKSTLWWVAGLSALDFYVGYLTILFLCSIVVVELIFSRTKPSPRILAAMAGVSLTILPQLVIFVKVHLPQSRAQTSHNFLKLVEKAVSGALLGPGLFPGSVLAGAMVLGLLACFGAALYKDWKASRAKAADFLRSMDPLLAFALVMLTAEVASGIAVKERNSIIVQVALWAWLSVRLFDLVLPIALGGSLIWLTGLLVGARNLATCQDTGKPSYNLPIYEVLNQIKLDARRRGVPLDQVYVVTWNDPFTLYGRLADLNMVSPFMRDPDQSAKPLYRMFVPKAHMVVLLTTGQQGWNGEMWQSALTMKSKTLADLAETKEDRFGYDPRFKLESKLTGTQELPYMIYYESGISTQDISLEWRGLW